MKPISQNQFGHNGNCLAASIASILERQIDEVPDYVSILKDVGQLKWPIYSQTESIKSGFTLTAVYFDGDLDLANDIANASIHTDGHFVVVGTTRDIDGVMHANVWNKDGFQFDPSLTGENRICNIEMAYVILLTNPPEYKPKPNLLDN